MKTNTKIGFIGLGIMGKPMAQNLVKSGYSLIVFDCNREAMNELIAIGAKAGISSKDVAKKCGVIITMLPNSPEVKDVMLGENGILEGAKSNTIVIDMSSIDPIIAKEIAVKLNEKGIEMLDAPVSGGEPKAKEGTLSIMVGGSNEIFEKVKDILLVMGSSAVLVGDIGSGNFTKLANQIIVAVNIAAMSEALVFASKAGINPEKVFEAIKGGLAGSTVLNAKVPMILDRNFEPGFRIELHIKDLMNAMDTAHKISVPLPLASQVLEMMQILKVDGKAKKDHSALVQYYEKLAGVEVVR
jgi:2-hydroxy-3-oxopropionate reductase